MQDPSFVQDYGEMATLVAKEYANWDRNDERFPLFRNFDPWEGHSWANGGYGMNPPIGNNQESSSEAMMSWGGTDPARPWPLTTAICWRPGPLDSLPEGAATNEYWFDRDDENLPPGYGPDGKIACILGGANVEYQTFFGTQPRLRARDSVRAGVAQFRTTWCRTTSTTPLSGECTTFWLIVLFLRASVSIGEWGDSDEWGQHWPCAMPPCLTLNTRSPTSMPLKRT